MGTSVRWLGVVLACGAGCAFIDDFGKFEVVDGSLGDAGGGDAGGPDSTVPDLECVDGVLAALPIEEAIDTSGLDDDYEGSCGGAGAPDVAYQWTAPRDDFYRFHTTGSDIETVLYLRDGDCDGEELACSDDRDGPLRSEIIQQLRQGQRVVAVLDGRAGDSGEATLIVEDVTCPAIQLHESILPVDQSTEGRPPYEGNTCAPEERGARTYRFTAPEDGNYSFLVDQEEDGPFHQPAVAVEAGPTCGGIPLQCNTGGQGRAEVLRYLEAGEHATVIVTGLHGDGPFVLDVQRRGSDSCIDAQLEILENADVEPGGLLTFNLPADGPHRTTTSCGGPNGFEYSGDTPDNPDLNIQMVVPNPSLPGCIVNSCAIHITAGFPFAASVSEQDSHGQCARRELFCDHSEYSSADDGTDELEIWFGYENLDGVPKVLTIDRQISLFGAVSDEVDVDIQCFMVCS
jgi:hypothetical protein